MSKLVITLITSNVFFISRTTIFYLAFRNQSYLSKDKDELIKALKDDILASDDLIKAKNDLINAKDTKIAALEELINQLKYVQSVSAKVIDKLRNNN